MNAAKSIRGGAARGVSQFICRPCLRRRLHVSSSQLDKSNDIRPPFRRPAKARNPKPQDSDGPGVVDETAFTPYTEEEIAQLRQGYTPRQVSAILAGEEAIPASDLISQGIMRSSDPWQVDYGEDTIEDFSRHHPFLDKPLPPPEGNDDPTQRFKRKDEIQRDFYNFARNLPEQPDGTELRRFMDEYRLMVGKETAELNPTFHMAPSLGKNTPGLATKKSLAKAERDESQRRSSSGTKGAKDRESAEVEVSPARRRLMQQTGYTMEHLRTVQTKNLVCHRVVNQTRTGKIQSMYYLTIAGNFEGLLGVGEGKSTVGADARLQAMYAAIRNLKPIPRYEKRTIYGEVKGKCGAVELELLNRPPGFGIRCQHLIYEMARLAGISDLAARVTRASNQMNTVKAAYAALLEQRVPDEIAAGLGRKLVDVRKVYYGGTVL